MLGELAQLRGVGATGQADHSGVTMIRCCSIALEIGDERLKCERVFQLTQGEGREEAGAVIRIGEKGNERGGIDELMMTGIAGHPGSLRADFGIGIEV